MAEESKDGKTKADESATRSGRRRRQKGQYHFAEDRFCHFHLVDQLLRAGSARAHRRSGLGWKTKNLALAKQTIDLIAMLEEKTRGNLTSDEENI
jgi:hypothetical protein